MVEAAASASRESRDAFGGGHAGSDPPRVARAGRSMGLLARSCFVGAVEPSLLVSNVLNVEKEWIDAMGITTLVSSWMDGGWKITRLAALPSLFLFQLTLHACMGVEVSAPVGASPWPTREGSPGRCKVG